MAVPGGVPTFTAEGPILAWLLGGDPAVAYATQRDLLGHDDPQLRRRIVEEGDASALLAARRADGHWGEGFYRPKWTSTHYTLLELAGLGVPSDHPACSESARLCATLIAADGGVSCASPPGRARSDVCVNGMFLTYAAAFGVTLPALTTVVDFVLGQRMADGGFNCWTNHGARPRVSSVHTTASVIEGFAAYASAGHAYRLDDVTDAIRSAVACLLARRLYERRSTGQPIHPAMIRPHHPARWRFDVLRGLEVLRSALRYAKVPAGPLGPALELVRGWRRPDGTWAAASGWPGQTHVAYPKAGTPNPWVTLRALRVLATFRASTEYAAYSSNEAGEPHGPSRTHRR